MTTEQAYLELATHSKITFDRQEKIIEALKKKLFESKKELMTCYGFIRILDNLLEEELNPMSPTRIIIEVLRGHLSELFETLFNANASVTVEIVHHPEVPNSEYL